MNLAQHKQLIHKALDAGDSDTVELYAEHCAQELNELGEELCAAVIHADGIAWAAVMAVAAQSAPGLADALEKIEEHVRREQDAFEDKRAAAQMDEAEHDAQCRAELDLILRRAS